MCNLSDIWIPLLTSFISGAVLMLLGCVLWAMRAMAEVDEHGADYE